MKRVLSVIPGPTFGGAANQVLRLHGLLRDAGFELLPVLPPDGEEPTRRLREAGIEVRHQPMHRLRATADPRVHAAWVRNTGGELGALRALTRELGADVVMNHGDLNPQAGIAGHLEGRAVAWQLLDTRTPPALRRLTMPLVTRIADVVMTVGDDLARLHPGVPELGARCVTTYPPVDAAAMAGTVARRAAARAELGVRADALVVGAVGNRNPQKGHEWLVRAAAQVRDRRPELAVLVLGAASPGHEAYEAAMRAEAERHGMDLTIVDPKDRVPELMGALDVLVLSSVPRSEGVPTVILEAMAAGLPVVATDVGAVREAVVDGVTGRVVAPLDAEALAAAIDEHAASKDLRETRGAAGRARIAETFSLEACAAAYVTSFERALDHRARR